MTDILGPASDNAVTTRPARSISRGTDDTWFKDCTGLDTNDGTAIGADFLNDVLAQFRTALLSSGINRDGADDMLWRAMQAVGIRYGVDTGAANAIVVNFPTAPVLALGDGLMLLVKLAANVTGATTVKVGGLDPVSLKWPDNTALANGDAKAGALLLIGYDGAKFQLLCRMNGGGAAPSAGAAVPGTIHMWPTETVPDWALECNGQAVSRTTYARLFGIIGTSYGTGNGTTTFNVPLASGKFIRAWDHGAGNDPDAGARGNRGDGTGGDHVGTTQGDQNKSHTHGVTGSISGPGVANVASAYEGGGTAPGGGYDTTRPLDFSLGTTGQGGNEARPKNIAFMVVIAV